MDHEASIGQRPRHQRRRYSRKVVRRIRCLVLAWVAAAAAGSVAVVHHSTTTTTTSTTTTTIEEEAPRWEASLPPPVVWPVTASHLPKPTTTTTTTTLQWQETDHPQQEYNPLGSFPSSSSSLLRRRLDHKEDRDQSSRSRSSNSETRFGFMRADSDDEEELAEAAQEKDSKKEDGKKENDKKENDKNEDQEEVEEENGGRNGGNVGRVDRPEEEEEEEDLENSPRPIRPVVVVWAVNNVAKNVMENNNDVTTTTTNNNNNNEEDLEGDDERQPPLFPRPPPEDESLATQVPSEEEEEDLGEAEDEGGRFGGNRENNNNNNNNNDDGTQDAEEDIETTDPEGGGRFSIIRDTFNNNNNNNGGANEENTGENNEDTEAEEEEQEQEEQEEVEQVEGGQGQGGGRFGIINRGDDQDDTDPEDPNNTQGDDQEDENGGRFGGRPNRGDEDNTNDQDAGTANEGSNNNQEEDEEGGRFSGIRDVINNGRGEDEEEDLSNPSNPEPEEDPNKDQEEDEGGRFDGIRGDDDNDSTTEDEEDTEESGRQTFFPRPDRDKDVPRPEREEDNDLVGEVSEPEEPEENSDGKLDGILNNDAEDDIGGRFEGDDTDEDSGSQEPTNDNNNTNNNNGSNNNSNGSSNNNNNNNNNNGSNNNNNGSNNDNGSNNNDNNSNNNNNSNSDPIETVGSSEVFSARNILDIFWSSEDETFSFFDENGFDRQAPPDGGGNLYYSDGALLYEPRSLNAGDAATNTDKNNSSDASLVAEPNPSGFFNNDRPQDEEGDGVFSRPEGRPQDEEDDDIDCTRFQFLDECQNKEGEEVSLEGNDQPPLLLSNDYNGIPPANIVSVQLSVGLRWRPRNLELMEEVIGRVVTFILDTFTPFETYYWGSSAEEGGASRRPERPDQPFGRLLMETSGGLDGDGRQRGRNLLRNPNVDSVDSGLVTQWNASVKQRHEPFLSEKLLGNRHLREGRLEVDLMYAWTFIEELSFNPDPVYPTSGSSSDIFWYLTTVEFAAFWGLSPAPIDETSVSASGNAAGPILEQYDPPDPIRRPNLINNITWLSQFTVNNTIDNGIFLDNLEPALYQVLESLYDGVLPGEDVLTFPPANNGNDESITLPPAPPEGEDSDFVAGVSVVGKEDEATSTINSEGNTTEGGVNYEYPLELEFGMREWLGLGLFWATSLVSIILLAWSSHLQRNGQFKYSSNPWSAALLTEQGLASILNVGWRYQETDEYSGYNNNLSTDPNRSGNQLFLQVYDKSKLGYCNDESSLLQGGIEQELIIGERSAPTTEAATTTVWSQPSTPQSLTTHGSPKNNSPPDSEEDEG